MARQSNFNVNMSVTANTSQFRKGLKSASSSADKASKSILGSISNIGNEIKRYAGVATSIFVFNQAGQVAADVMRTSSAIKGLRAEYTKLGGDISRARQETSGMVSDMQIMSTSNLASQFGIGSSQTVEMMKFAATQAQKLGIDADKALSDIITGTARSSVKILDNLGISAKRFRLELEKTGDSATAVVNIIEEMGNTGGGDDAAMMYSKVAASFENLKVSISEMMMDDLNINMETFDSTLKGVSDTIMSVAGVVSLLLSNIGKIIALGLTVRAYKFGKSLTSVFSTMTATVGATRKLLSMMQRFGAAKTYETVTRLSSSFKGLKSSVNGASVALGAATALTAGIVMGMMSISTSAKAAKRELEGLMNIDSGSSLNALEGQAKGLDVKIAAMENALKSARAMEASDNATSRSSAGSLRVSEMEQELKALKKAKAEADKAISLNKYDTANLGRAKDLTNPSELMGFDAAGRTKEFERNMAKLQTLGMKTDYGTKALEDFIRGYQKLYDDLSARDEIDAGAMLEKELDAEMEAADRYEDKRLAKQIAAGASDAEAYMKEYRKIMRTDADLIGSVSLAKGIKVGDIPPDLAKEIAEQLVVLKKRVKEESKDNEDIEVFSLFTEGNGKKILNGVDSMASTFGGAMTSALTGTKSGVDALKSSFQSLGATILTELTAIIAKMAILALLKMIIAPTSFAGMFGGGSIVGIATGMGGAKAAPMSASAMSVGSPAPMELKVSGRNLMGVSGKNSSFQSKRI